MAGRLKPHTHKILILETALWQCICTLAVQLRDICKTVEKLGRHGDIVSGLSSDLWLSRNSPDTVAQLSSNCLATVTRQVMSNFLLCFPYGMADKEQAEIVLSICYSAVTWQIWMYLRQSHDRSGYIWDSHLTNLDISEAVTQQSRDIVVWLFVVSLSARCSVSWLLRDCRAANLHFLRQSWDSVTQLCNIVCTELYSLKYAIVLLFKVPVIAGLFHVAMG